MSWNYKDYFKEIVYVACMFGICALFCQEYITGDVFYEITLEDFRASVITWSYIIGFLHSIIAVIWAFKYDLYKWFIDFKTTFIKSGLSILLYIIMMSVLYSMTEIDSDNLLKCILRFVMLFLINLFAAMSAFTLKKKLGKC